jgi:hypothetical protein
MNRLRGATMVVSLSVFLATAITIYAFIPSVIIFVGFAKDSVMFSSIY